MTPKRDTSGDGGRTLTGRRMFIALVAMMVVVGMTPALAADTVPVTDELNTAEWDEENTAPHPITKVDVTTSAQDLSQGTSDEAIAGYENDSGDWVSGSDSPFTVNTSHDIESGANVNPYTFTPSHIEDSGLQAFPDGHTADDDWLNASTAGTNPVWDVTDTGGNLSLTETSVVSGVDGIRFNTGTSGDSGIANGDVMYSAKYNQTGDLAEDTDEGKRVLIIAGDMDTLEANTEVQIRIDDESGSYKQVVANTSGTAFTGNNFASGTGSFFYQVKLSTLTTQGTDSTFDNIESITVRQVADGTTNGDADFTISALDIRRKTKLQIGEMRATTDDDGNDPDSDGDYDQFQTVYNATGDVSVHSMGTLASEFDDAVIHDLTYPAHYEAGGLDQQGEDGDYVVYWQNASNPGYDHELNVTYQLTLPSAIDLSYSNAEVNMTQKWGQDRYLELGVNDDVADSTDLSEADMTSQLDSLGAQGDEIQLDNAPAAGDNVVVHYVLQVTDDERTNDLEAAADDGGGAAAPPAADGGGNILTGLWNFLTGTIPGWIVSGLGIFGIIRWYRNR